MRAVGCCAAIALAGSLAACSTHPLPQDVSAQASTVDIVRSIRCEARAGIESATAGLSGDALASLVPIVKATMIGYDFNFDMDEKNGAGQIAARVPPPLLSFSQPGRLTANASANASLERKNVRTFTIIEPLVELTRPETVEVCKDRRKGPHWSYPIAGSIGVDEIVHTYLRLELLTELNEVSKKAAGQGASTKTTEKKKTDTKKTDTKKTDGSGAESGHVVFSDELSFTTTYSAGATGELILDAVVGQLRLKNVSIGAGASRTDTHSVIVALTRKSDGGSRPPPGGGPGGKASTGSKAKSGSKETAAEERARLIAEGSVRDPRSQARLIQMNASAQDSVAVELQQRRARKDADNDAAKALGQRFLDLLKEP